jgi:NAD(P)-dependent dehydrogenase (short-subunit alcohol dehydrogenase family)
MHAKQDKPKSAPAALVTGGAKRIGRSIALALAREGLDIALHYNASAADAQKLAGEIRALGRECHLFRCDLSDMDQVFSLPQRVFEVLPGWNVLINSASVFERASLAETTEVHFDRTFDINFKTPFFLARDFAARCENGLVVNLLDTKISQNFTEYFVYSLTKKTLANFTEMAAKALAPRVRVNGVCPGLILPPPGQGPEYLEKLSSRVPMRRPGTPEAVADAVVYFLRNDYVTGQILYVDGGEHLT